MFGVYNIVFGSTGRLRLLGFTTHRQEFAAIGTGKYCFNRQQRHQVLRAASQVSPYSTAHALLDAYWQARGVFDPKQRLRLVETATSQQGLTDDATELQSGVPLPGIPATWTVDTSIPEIREVSRRLVQLQTLLGGSTSVDVVWMVTREPGLLTADYATVTRALWAMKVALGDNVVDVVRVAEAQPSLLLRTDLSGMSKTGLQELLAAWRFGLHADGADEWNQRFEQLAAYSRAQGDAHVGFRDGDDQELSRWASKQRSAWKSGELEEARAAKLQSIGFEVSEDEAEWQRWLAELRRFRMENGHCSPPMLAAGIDLYLINWCSVQRIARRSRVLSARRIEQLDELGFDWTGADPLS